MLKENRPPNIASFRPIKVDELIFRRMEFPSVDPVAATAQVLIVELPEELENLETPVSQHISESDTTGEKSKEEEEFDRSDLNQTPAVPAETKVLPTQELSVDGDAAASLAKFQSENANIILERNNLINQVMKLQEDLSRSREDFVLLASLYLTLKETFELETHVHEEEKTDLNVDLRDCRLRVAQLELEAQTLSVSSSISTMTVGTQTEVSEDTTTVATVFTKIQPADPIVPHVTEATHPLLVHGVTDSHSPSLVISVGIAEDDNNLQTQDNLIYDLSNVSVGLRSKVSPIKFRNALTDGRFEERKEDVMNKLWLQNRLLQVETERDWISEEKARLEELVADKAEIAMQYISQLIRENEAMSSSLKSEVERTAAAEKRADEEKAIRMQDRIQFRRMRADHEEIEYELKSTRIDLEESKSIIVELQEKIELSRLSTLPQAASVLDIDDQHMKSFNEENVPEPKTAAPVFTCSDIRYKGRTIEGYTVIPANSSKVPQYDTGAEVDENVSRVIFDFFVPSPIPSPDERLEVSPPESFCVLNEVIKSDLGFTIQLTNIPSVHFGRIVGRGGQNVNKIKEKYKVNITVLRPKNPQDRITVIVTSGSATDRHSAAEEIVGDLPVDVEVFFRAKQNVKKRAQNSCPFVRVKDSGKGKFLLSGKLRECRKVFEDLKSSV